MKQDWVDRSLSEWSRQMPELDLSGRHLLWRLALVNKFIDHRITAAIAEVGLSDGVFKLMLRLLRAGPPYEASPTDLARDALYTSGAMTNVIARAESDGLVKRSPDPHDRRGVRVSLTPAGLERITAAYELYVEQERLVLDMLTDEERDQMVELLRKMLLQLEESGDWPALKR